MGTESSIKSKIKELERTAKTIRDLKEGLDGKGFRRPLVIEFCGIPKSGKTTSLNALNTFLKRNEFKTKLLTERASVCPISKKTHPYFNIWTMTRALSELLETISEAGDSIDIILADRAMFDSLIWFEWLSKNPNPDNPHLDSDTYNAIVNMVTCEFITKCIDLVLVFNSTPEKALEREYSTLLTDNPGSIMNNNVLKGYQLAQQEVMEKYKSNFHDVIVIEENPENDLNEKNYNVTKQVLNKLEDLVVEKILYFDYDKKNAVKPGISEELFYKNLDMYAPKFASRDEVEKMEYLHPIPIAVITNKERSKVLVLKKDSKSLSEHSPEKDRLLLYSGGHVRKEDSVLDESKNGNIICDNAMRKALSREIYEELNESITFNDSLPFTIYTPDVKGSSKHVAICYIAEVDMDNMKFNPSSYEHVKKKGTSKSGKIFSIDELESFYNDFEDWSKLIIKHVFKRHFRTNTLLDFLDENLN